MTQLDRILRLPTPPGLGVPAATRILLYTALSDSRFRSTVLLCKVLVGVFALFHGAPAIADNAVRAGDVMVDPPTLYCLGFRWMVSGDENGNARGT